MQAARGVDFLHAVGGFLSYLVLLIGILLKIFIFGDIIFLLVKKWGNAYEYMYSKRGLLS